MEEFLVLIPLSNLRLEKLLFYLFFIIKKQNKTNKRAWKPKSAPYNSENFQWARKHRKIKSEFIKKCLFHGFFFFSHGFRGKKKVIDSKVFLKVVLHRCNSHIKEIHPAEGGKKGRREARRISIFVDWASGKRWQNTDSENREGARLSKDQDICRSDHQTICLIPTKSVNLKQSLIREITAGEHQDCSMLTKEHFIFLLHWILNV